MTEVDLTKRSPRSPYDMLAGIVMLARTIDKAKAFNAKKLGEYHYNCPLDKALFEFLGTDDVEFAKKVKDLETDEKIKKWAKSKMSDKVKDQFNNWMRHGVPDTADKLKWMESEKKKLKRSDYFSYFDNIDADEKRF